MKKHFIILFLIGLVSIIALTGCSTATKTDASSSQVGSAAAKTDTTLTIEDMLTYAIQDEYLARAEYEIILKEYSNQSPFANIIKAEETHIAALTTLFNTYNIALPPDTSSEYVSLPPSINDAYTAGVNAEIENIAMYERFLQQDLPDDIKNTFTTLKTASQSHLEAFRQRQSKCLY